MIARSQMPSVKVGEALTALHSFDPAACTPAFMLFPGCAPALANKDAFTLLNNGGGLKHLTLNNEKTDKNPKKQIKPPFKNGGCGGCASLKSCTLEARFIGGFTLYYKAGGAKAFTLTMPKGIKKGKEEPVLFNCVNDLQGNSNAVPRVTKSRSALSR